MTRIERDILILEPNDRVGGTTPSIGKKVIDIMSQKVITGGTLISISPHILQNIQHFLRQKNQSQQLITYNSRTCIPLQDLKDNWVDISKNIGGWEQFEIYFGGDIQPTKINHHVKSFTAPNGTKNSFYEILSWQVQEIQHSYEGA